MKLRPQHSRNLDRMSELLAERCASRTFALKDDILTALAAVDPPVKTVDDLKAYDGRRLLCSPPNAETVKALLEACKAQKATIDDNVAGRTALGHVIQAATGDDAGSQGSDSKATESRQAQEFGTLRYNDLGRKMVSRVSQEDRIDGSLVKKAHDDLDRGVLSSQCYNLPGLTSILTTQETKTVNFGGVPVERTEEAAVDLGRNGQVLLMIHRCLRMLLAAGYREVKPSPQTPNAASAGEYGTIEYKQPGGGTKKVRHHMTPETADMHMLSAIRGSSTLSPSQLASAHVKLFDRAGNYLATMNFNLDSALMRAHSERSFVTILADYQTATPAKALTPRQEGDDRMKELEAENKQLVNTVQQLKQTRRTPAETATPTKKAKVGICVDFQTKGSCTKANCNFPHECARCGSTKHGLVACTATVNPVPEQP